MSPSPEITFWPCKACGHSYTVNDVAYPPLPEHLLTTNFPPSQQELSDLGDALSDVLDDLVVVDQEIASFQRILDALHARRRKMEAHLRACRSIMSPYRHIPSEILVEVMQWATIVTVGEHEEVTLDTKRGIWTYSHVCQTWRANALSTPSFWSTIFINLGSKACDGQSTCVETILSRTGHHPLSFKFVYDPLQEDWGADAANRSLRYFTERATQWREVSFRLPPMSLDIFRFVRNRITQLESLNLELVHNSPAYYDVDYLSDLHINHFEDAPALHEVSFSNLIHPNLLQLPWSQITHYSATMACGDPLESLQQMPNLQSLKLESGDNRRAGQVELRNLRRLRVMNSDVIPALTLPALCELNICTMEVELLIDLVERSACCLNRLELQRWNDYTNQEIMNPDTLFRFFEVIPTLSVLDLAEENVQRIMIVILRPGQHSPLLPVLTELILPPIDRITYDSARILIRFLQQRRSPQFVSPTTRAVESVVFVGAVRPLGPEMQSLQRDGLRVSFERMHAGKDYYSRGMGDDWLPIDA